MEKTKYWKVKVCIGLVILIFTIISIILGIIAVIMTAGVLGKLEDNDSDAEAASIIIDALESWNTTLPTEIKTVDKDTGCDEGWESVFTQRWPGTDQGCWYEGQAMTEG